MKNTTNTAGVTDTREIPPLPGGGSWTFDPGAWKWVSNDPAPAEQAADIARASAPDQSADNTSKE